MTVLHIEGIGKRFGGVAAVSGVDMVVPPGKITGIIGPNGAGKTTLVNLITGTLAIDQGIIRFGDQDLTKAPAHKIARGGIARTFQNIRLMAEASVIENIMIGFYRNERTSTFSSLLGMPGALRQTRLLREQALDLLKRFSMERYSNHVAGSLAYGHQRKVEIMRALASQPKVILLDEPVAGMNDVEAAELGNAFRAMANSDVAVLLIEHNIRFVVKHCDYLYVLDSGKLISQGEPIDVIKDPAVITAYFGT